MAAVSPELLAHRAWLGQIQQVGLVVAPQVLVNNGVHVNRQDAVQVQTRLRELLADASDSPSAPLDFLALARDVLGWSDDMLAGAPDGPALPDSLTVALPEHEDTLAPTFALPEPASEGAWLALIVVVQPGTAFDKAAESHAGWRASAHARLERLLRETRVPIGLLFNGAVLRLVYAPHGESSGHLTFALAHLAETLGRPMAGALVALLGRPCVTDVSIEQQRLPYLLRESRRYQNDVSTELAGQVLEALWELLRGLQRANHERQGALLAEVLRQRPEDVYGGLLTTMMRLVFILYAEDRGLMPASEVYQRGYAVSGLFERLRDDQARHPDTMDDRYGAWPQLLVLFRLVHDGGGHGGLRFPPRHGRLFDPDAYPFLEGRPHGSRRQLGEAVEPPKIADGVVFRVLTKLLVLEGERLSYRTLDVEQIGSVYEAMMGFALQQSSGTSIAVAPKHVVINVDDLLEQPAKSRADWLKKQADLKLTGEALGKAATAADVVAAIGKKVSRFTPHPLKVGDLFLQPTEERRRSGSHYTPRSLTGPIVETTFRPMFERFGAAATPDQILDLKVCDPAMGSGAFLVAACRLLADRLVKAWEFHRTTPTIPAEEDAHTYARRLVAERCLYGVDKNIFAVDLAKLSLWLATLAHEHPFTFLDHALRHGDSLVGLSREQIACLHWTSTKQLPLIRTFIDARVAEAQQLRLRIQRMGASDDVPEKARLLREADDALLDVRLIGDVVVSAFFDRDKPRERETRRVAVSGSVQQWLDAKCRTPPGDLVDAQDGLRSGERPVPVFHWEVEFPEVFVRANPGFDVFVGNPPFAGKNTIAAGTRESYLPWLLAMHEASHGNADLVAHFFRRAFALLRQDGSFGLIATNTIAQGDTRGTGLRWIRQHGGTIFEARKRVKWPAPGAAVIVSVVHVAKGTASPPFRLDGSEVDRITAFLFHAGGDNDPAQLQANARKSFIGSYVLGMGFTFDDTDTSGVASPLSLMRELITKDERNKERIFSYIGGDEVNDSPTHSGHRYVINFGQMSEAEARQWPQLMAILESKVRPERELNNREGYRRYWWQYAEKRRELQEAIRGLERVLVVCRHQPHWAVAILDAQRVFAESLVIFAVDPHVGLALLQARPHEVWSRAFGSSLEERPRYTPSDCFETYPFPDAWTSDSQLARVGRIYGEYRAALMIRNAEGLTKTYNRFHDPAETHPDILKLRELHDAMDRAVLDAYGWTNIRPTCTFILDHEGDEDDTLGKASKKRKPWRYRWPDNIRDEVLGRLLALNAERAAAEATAGAAALAAAKKRTGKAKPERGALLDL